MEAEEVVNHALEQLHGKPRVQDGLERGVFWPIPRMPERQRRKASQHNGTRHSEGDASCQILPQSGEAGEIVAGEVDGELCWDACTQRVRRTMPKPARRGIGGQLRHRKGCVLLQ